MIATPPSNPPAQEQVIHSKLVQCGLRADGFTVKYEREIERVVIIIDGQVGAKKENFECIRAAVTDEIVRFKDSSMQKAFLEENAKLMNSRMLIVSREYLEGRGLLDGFPDRSDFPSSKLFMQALEQRCGAKSGSFFQADSSQSHPQSTSGKLDKASSEKMSCLMNSVMYANAQSGNFKMGFIGKELLPPSK